MVEKSHQFRRGEKVAPGFPKKFSAVQNMAMGITAMV